MRTAALPSPPRRWVAVAAGGAGLLLLVVLLLAAAAAAGAAEAAAGAAAAGAEGTLLRRALKQHTSDGGGGTAPLPPSGQQGGGAHKPFYPLDQADVITIGLAALGLIVAAGGGIGGGGILVPLYILVLGFGPRNAVPLSNVTILGGAIANVLAGLRGRHPFADRPLLDFTLILMMEPTTIVGAVVGSFVGKVLPELAVSVLLVLVLAALAHRTLKKGLRQLEKEGGLASLCSVGDRWARRHARLLRRRRRRQQEAGAGAGSRNGAREGETVSPAWSSSSSSSSSGQGVEDDEEEEEDDEELLMIGSGGPSPAAAAAAAATVATEATALLPKKGRAGGKGSNDEGEGQGDDDGGVPPEILSTRSVSSPAPAYYGTLPSRASSSPSPASPSPLPPPRAARRHSAGSWAGAAVVDEEGEEEEEEEQAEEGEGDGTGPSTPAKGRGGDGNGGSNPELAAILERERRIPPWQPATLTACFLGILASDVLKGGEGAPSPLGFACGSWGYWLATLAALPWVAVFFLGIRRRVLAEHAAKVRAGYDFQPGDIQWTPVSTVKFPLICVLAGLFAGIFGVGGGIVKGPLMLEMGVLPPVAAASAACMILYTSAAASAAYYVFGLIPVDYGAFFFVFGFCCTAIGQAAVSHMLQKYRRESFIVLSIGLVILLSACLMGFEAVADVLEDPRGAVAFSSLCGTK